VSVIIADMLGLTDYNFSASLIAPVQMTPRVGFSLVCVPMEPTVPHNNLTKLTGDACRLAFDLGLHRDCSALESPNDLSQIDLEARSITFWGCFIFDR
jgi:hypothetical protein